MAEEQRMNETEEMQRAMERDDENEDSVEELSEMVMEEVCLDDEQSDEKAEEGDGSDDDSDDGSDSSSDDSDDDPLEWFSDPEILDAVLNENRPKLRRIVQCPMCSGTIRNTLMLMGCLHRFCEECVENSLRNGNHHCPVCYNRFENREYFIEDENFDEMIEAVYMRIVASDERDENQDQGPGPNADA